MLPIIISSPLEVAGVAFLRLKKVKRWLWVYIITNRTFHLLCTSVCNQKQQQITFKIILSWGSAYHPKHCTIDLILPNEKDYLPRCNHKEYPESWKKDMEGAFEVELTKAKGRKEKKVQEIWSQTMLRSSWTRWQSGGKKSFTKREYRKTEVVLGTGGCRGDTKIWKWWDLHHQNNLTARKSSDITQKHISTRRSYIINTRWHKGYLSHKSITFEES